MTALLLTSSLIGSLFWLLLLLLKPITQKFFSQTWHYYSGLVSVFFLLGGSLALTQVTDFSLTAIYALSAETEVETLPSAEHLSSLAAEVTPPQEHNYDVTYRPIVNELQLTDYNKITEIFSSFWLIGMFVYFILKAMDYLKLRRNIFRFHTVQENMTGKIKIIRSTSVTTPMLIGIWKPTVILPDIKLSEKELSVILSHELVHQKRGDLVIKLIVLIANGIHWFNPIAYVITRNIDVLCENSCDEQVVREMDTSGRKFYGQTILAMLEYSTMCKSSVYMGFCNSKEDIKRRLINMMNFKKAKKSITAVSLAVTIACIGGGGVLASALPEFPDDISTEWVSLADDSILLDSSFMGVPLQETFEAFGYDVTYQDDYTMCTAKNDEKIYFVFERDNSTLGSNIKKNHNTYYADVISNCWFIEIEVLLDLGYSLYEDERGIKIYDPDRALELGYARLAAKKDGLSIVLNTLRLHEEFNKLPKVNEWELEPYVQEVKDLSASELQDYTIEEINGMGYGIEELEDYIEANYGKTLKQFKDENLIPLEQQYPSTTDYSYTLYADGTVMVGFTVPDDYPQRYTSAVEIRDKKIYVEK